MIKNLLRSFSNKEKPASPMPPTPSNSTAIEKKSMPVAEKPQQKNATGELSKLFITSLLGEDQHDDIGQHNPLNEGLLSRIQHELKHPNVDSIPKLAQASMNLMQMLMDEDTPADELVRVVEEDPALLGKVLDLANSAFYKTSSTDIENLNQALVLLGNNGLKKLVMSTLVADKLKISTIYFKVFGANIWKHSHDVAVIAAQYAKENNGSEFRAYLNGLLHDIGKLVIFKQLIEVLKEEHPDSYPSAGFFAKVINVYGHKLTLTVLQQWSFNTDWIKPILTYNSKIPFENMDPDSQALFIANWCSEYHFLYSKGQIEQQTLQDGLLELGIEIADYRSLTARLQ